MSLSEKRRQRGQLDPRVANAMGYLASILLKALENGRIEDRLAHLEAAFASTTGKETDAFDFKQSFRPAKEAIIHEEPSTASEGD